MTLPNFEVIADLYDNGSNILLIKREDFITALENASKLGYNQAVADCVKSAEVISEASYGGDGEIMDLYTVDKQSIIKNKIE